VFTKEHVYKEYKVTAQTAASNGNSGTKASELEKSWGGTGIMNSILITPAEQPVKTEQEVLDRARNEALWHEGPVIEATVTVQGWFRDEENVWWPGDVVFVYSPMCPLNQLMKIQTVTFTQDNNSGTETTLELKQPWALKDRAHINPAPMSTTTNETKQVQPGQEIAPAPG